MGSGGAGARAVDEYIAGYPPEVRTLLEKVRRTIREAAPEAQETISYGIPTFKLSGKNLVHFAGFKRHIGLYPTPSGIEEFKRELAPYASGKGSARFALDEPVPYDLITRIMKFRVKDILEKAAAGAKRQPH